LTIINNLNFKKKLASVSAMSLLCTVPIFIESYHERRRERPDETLATLYLKEGATFYFILNLFWNQKIDNTRIRYGIS
jgi:hypothetical protein